MADILNMQPGQYILCDIWDMQTGEHIKVNSSWITAQWNEDGEIRSISRGKATSVETLERAIALQLSLEELLEGAPKAATLFELWKREQETGEPIGTEEIKRAFWETK